MDRSCSSIWLSSHNCIRTRIMCIIDSARSKKSQKKPVLVFFRADDIAVPGEKFRRLINLFNKHKTPLALAVVPAWLTEPRWQSIKKLLQEEPALWCLHQHGWRHRNYEEKDKRQEFGGSRTESQKIEDITQGRQKLLSLLGKDFYPVFTPPWNRCDEDTLNALKELGYYAVSRMNKKWSKKNGIQDFSVNVDLHTRKEPHPLKSMNFLLNEMESSLTREICGIMIHHQRMNDEAFSFLEALITVLRESDKVNIVRLQDLVETYRM